MDFQPVSGLQDDITVVPDGKNVIEWIDGMQCISVMESNETPEHNPKVQASRKCFNKIELMERIVNFVVEYARKGEYYTKMMSTCFEG